MKTGKGTSELYINLKNYKQKYYLNKLIKGVILTLAAASGLFLLYNTLEFAGNFVTPVRAFLFFSFIALVASFLYIWIINPITKLLFINKQISNEEAARQIGHYFPDINDKLLNTLQLQTQQFENNHLLQASIQQRTTQLSLVPFVDAVRVEENKKHLKWVLFPALICMGILFMAPEFFTLSTTRIIHFDREFVPEAPFTFVLGSQELTAFKNEDYLVKLTLEGNNIPANVYMNTNGRRVKMIKNEQGNFEYTLQKLQDDHAFYFDAAGFSSASFNLLVRARPVLKNFQVKLHYPAYLQRPNEELGNVGNFTVPEGTVVNWQFNALETEALSIQFEGGEPAPLSQINAMVFSTEKQMNKSTQYQLFLKNKFSTNKDEIKYQIEVIPDVFPEINLEQYQDTTFFKYLVLGGNISDDYGLTKLQLFYKINSQDQASEDKYQTHTISIDPNQNSQSYYYQWRVDSLQLAEGDQIEYFLQVWDNDGVNGAKASKTSTYTFAVPSKEEVAEEIDNASQQAENQIDNTKVQAQELQEDLKNLNDKLKGKKKLDWQDEQKLQQLLEKREALEKGMEKLKEQNQTLNEKRERFDSQKENIKEKAEQLQKLMDELLDEETKKLYEELKKLLEENKNIHEIQKNLNELNKREENLEKELDRALELFKRMKFDMKLDEVVEDLKELSEGQEKLAEENKSGEKKKEELLEEQKQLNDSFEETEEEIQEMKEMNQELKNPEPLSDTSEEEESIKKDQQESQELLQNNKKKPAQKKQKNASEKLGEMAKKMEQMQGGMEMEMMSENLDNLRDIVSNLLTLSFDQEDLMKEFKNVNQSDPRFVELSQTQLKLKDDAKIIEDSLYSLAQRVFQIESFVTREVGEMKQKMDESVDALKERNQPLAISRQQFAMTSMNNLALLLDDVLQQMQQQMADAMGSPQDGKDGKSKAPSLGELQEQLNKKIEGLKNSGKSGRELSEQLARMAAEQEMIRQAMQELSEGLEKGNNGKEGGAKEIIEKMEETETDLVNKQITSETIERQKEILTRLLQSEDAMREKELDEERESEKAKSYAQDIPKDFKEYIQLKEKEIELLRTIPLKLNPYYKNEVNEYFKLMDK